MAKEKTTKDEALLCIAVTVSTLVLLIGLVIGVVQDNPFHIVFIIGAAGAAACSVGYILFSMIRLCWLATREAFSLTCHTSDTTPRAPQEK